MTRYVALLRGINVGGKNLIKMPALKACFEADGFRNVSTYIQSGNVLFESADSSSSTLTRRIEEMLAEAFDYVPTVVVRNRRQMRGIVERAPKGFGTEPKEDRYDVFFLREPLTGTAAMKHLPTDPAVDRAHVGIGVLYVSRLAAKATQSRLNRIISSPIYPSVTIRNWNTTTKLLELMGQVTSSARRRSRGLTSRTR